MLKLDVNIELLKDAPIIYLQTAASSVKGVQSSIKYKSFTDILMKHHQGCTWLSMKSTILNTSITKKNVAYIVEHEFRTGTLNQKRVTKFDEIQKLCQNNSNNSFKIFVNLRIPRRYEIQSEQLNDPDLSKQNQTASISLDHFITSVFNESIGMNLLLMDDTIEDLEIEMMDLIQV
eukprot:g8075.t1